MEVYARFCGQQAHPDGTGVCWLQMRARNRAQSLTPLRESVWEGSCESCRCAPWCPGRDGARPEPVRESMRDRSSKEAVRKMQSWSAMSVLKNWDCSIVRRTTKVLKFRRDPEDVLGAVKLPQESQEAECYICAMMVRTPCMGRPTCVKFWYLFKLKVDRKALKTKSAVE